MIAAVGMSACLGAVIRAPLTSTLIVFEMTHQFAVVPGLMLGAVISQGLARVWGGKHNFYDSLLLQDGHELIKINPPRDLQGWQNLPILHIMNVNPAMVTRLDQKEIENLLKRSPYKRFPVLLNDEITGIATRTQLMQFVKDGERPVFEKAVACHSGQCVREVANTIVDSPSGMLLIIMEESGKIAGLITLHDLLRAQTAVAE
jgi:CIC family chloride channel protein